MRIHSFKPIKGFEKEYTINKEGAVKSISRRRVNAIGRFYTNKETVMTQFIDRGGYQTVKLTRERKSGTKYLHRLLALTFIENPNNYTIVNHINGNKLDNSLENLEWVSRSQNQLHAIRLNLAKIPCLNKRKVLDRCTGRSFDSIKAACKEYKIGYDHCKKMLYGKIYNYTCLHLAA